MLSNYITLIEWMSYGHLGNGVGGGGLSVLTGINLLGYLYWIVATYRDAIYLRNEIIAYREWQSYGVMIDWWQINGIVAQPGDAHLANSHWYIATNNKYIMWRDSYESLRLF